MEQKLDTYTIDITVSKMIENIMNISKQLLYNKHNRALKPYWNKLLTSLNKETTAAWRVLEKMINLEDKKW